MAGVRDKRDAVFCNVLLVRFSAIGDVAISVPVVRSLAAAYPGTSFTVLTSVRFLPFFRGLPSNVSLIGVDLRKDYHGRGGVRRLFRMLEPMGFDAVADLHGVLRTYSLGLMFRLRIGCVGLQGVKKLHLDFLAVHLDLGLFLLRR